MTALLGWLAVLVACASTPHADRIPARNSLRVVTYNIFGGHDLQRLSNLTRIAALIDSLRADFVLLQEVDRLTARSGHVDQASVLAERVGMHAVFGRAMDYDGGEYGIAVLSRWPLRSWRVVPLAASPATDSTTSVAEPRALLHVVTEAPGGVVHVLNTHLDHQARAGARHAQLFRALAYMAEAIPRGSTVVFGGDLNAQPDASEVRALGMVFDDAWSKCGAGAGHTFRSDNPTRRIDHILLIGAVCTHAQVIATTISDHRPLIVDLTVSR